MVYPAYTPWVYTRMYTRMHTRMHTRMYTRMYTRIHPYTPVHTRIHPYTPVYTRIPRLFLLWEVKSVKSGYSCIRAVFHTFNTFSQECRGLGGQGRGVCTGVHGCVRGDHGVYGVYPGENK